MNRLQRHSQFQTNDPKAAGAQIQRVLHRKIELKGSPRFHFEMSTATLQLITVNYLGFTGPVTNDSRGDGGYYLLVRAEAGTVERHWSDAPAQTLQPGSGMLVPPNSIASGVLPDDFESLIICIPSTLMDQEADRVLGARPEQPIKAIPICDMNSSSHLGQRIDFIVEQLDRPDGVFHTKPLFGLDLQRSLVRNLIATVDNSYAGLLTKRIGAARVHINALEELLIANLENAPNLDLPKMAFACKVSERTLRTSCQRERGMGPDEYFEFLRLHAAHTHLENPEADTTVTSVMWRFGFSNPGRFADAYRAIFHGESPGETLARGKKKIQIAFRAAHQ